MATFLQSVRVCQTAEDQSIIDQFGCGQSEDEPDCTGLCLLLTFLVITVFVIIVIVIIIFFFFFTNYNSAYCLSIKRWNL